MVFNYVWSPRGKRKHGKCIKEEYNVKSHCSILSSEKTELNLIQATRLCFIMATKICFWHRQIVFYNS